jgi:hypothetical protein
MQHGIHLGPFHWRQQWRHREAAPLLAIQAFDTPFTPEKMDTISIPHDASLVPVTLQSYSQ